MKNKVLVYIGLLLIGIFTVSSRSFASDADTILAELNRLNIKVAGPIEPEEDEIPVNLSGPYWGVLKGVCSQGGYDLSAYAGKKVMLVNLPIANNSDYPLPLDVIVFSCQEKIVCVYKVDKESAPGMLPVSNPKKSE